MSRWLIRRMSSKDILGPYTPLEVADNIKKNQFSLDDYICEEGFATWTTIEKRKEIVKLLDVDLKEQQEKSREAVDESRLDEFVFEEPSGTSIHEASEKERRSQTWIRWLVLGLFLLIAGVVLQVSLLKQDGEVSAPPPEKKAVMKTQQQKIGTRRPGQPTRPVKKRDSVSRFSSFDPNKAFEKRQGTLQQRDEGSVQEPRRRIARPATRPPTRPRPQARPERPRRVEPPPVYDEPVREAPMDDEFIEDEFIEEDVFVNEGDEVFEEGLPPEEEPLPLEDEGLEEIDMQEVPEGEEGDFGPEEALPPEDIGPEETF